MAPPVKSGGVQAVKIAHRRIEDEKVIDEMYKLVAYRNVLITVTDTLTILPYKNAALLLADWSLLQAVLTTNLSKPFTAHLI